MFAVGAVRVVAGADVRGVGAAGGRARAGARAAAGRARPARHRAQQEGIPGAPRALARRARRRRPERVARARLPRGEATPQALRITAIRAQSDSVHIKTLVKVLVYFLLENSEC